MCFGESIYFSMKMSSIPNAFFASDLASWKFLISSSSFCTIRIPLPPPPAEALSITGYPQELANSTASESDFIACSTPGIVGTFAA